MSAYVKMSVYIKITTIALFLIASAGNSQMFLNTGRDRCTVICSFSRIVHMEKNDLLHVSLWMTLVDVI